MRNTCSCSSKMEAMQSFSQRQPRCDSLLRSAGELTTVVRCGSIRLHETTSSVHVLAHSNFLFGIFMYQHCVIRLFERAHHSDANSGAAQRRAILEAFLDVFRTGRNLPFR